ncbi:MAG: CoA transferase [Rhodobacterales bacterium]|nr:CoA transferase [Rhodobacterales bacterium]
MRALQGITVVAVEQAVSAPYASMRLTDAGARVIKVERPEGDFARFYDDAAAGQSSYFVWLNRGKDSVALDLAAPAGRDALAALIAGADVLIQNLKPGALDRTGLAPAALRAANPRLIACAITGYGRTGPMADRKAYDLLIQAESGLCSVTGGPETPARVGISVVDIATGAAAHAAILEALIRRGLTGQGAEIEVSMFDVMAKWLTVPLLNHLAGRPPRRMGLAHPSIAPYGVFTARDGGQVLIAVQNDREWAALCAGFLGDAALARDPRHAANLARITHRADTDALVAAAFARQDAAAAIAALTAAGIALASVNDMAGLAAHPHLRMMTVETPAGPVSLPAPPVRVADEAFACGPVPALPEPGT